MERYEAYKDSGVEWIGEIPENWTVDKVVRLFITIGSGTTPKTDNEAYYDGDIPWVQSGDLGSWRIADTSKTVTEEAIRDISALTIYRAPYIAIAMYGASIGSMSIVDIRSCVNQACCVLSNCKDSMSYYAYVIDSAKKYLIDQGIGGTQPNISQQVIRGLWLPRPSLAEQQVIADYLDVKTAEIDAIVADCEREVGLLREYRKAVISEAVTKGLDPDAPMKDSGIEWIGEIPDGWKCCRVKQVAYISSGATPNRDNYSYWNGSIPWVKTGELQNALISESEECITETALDETSVQLYPAGTILMAMYGQGKTRGMTGMLTMASTTNQACAAIQVYTADEPMFIWKALTAGYDAIRDVALGSGQPNLNAELVSNFYIPLPNSVEEQRRIVAVLDTKTAEIDFLIEAKQSMADKLREYRRSLISETVTGKVKVQGVN